jgi:hypothetical protein
MARAMLWRCRHDRPLGGCKYVNGDLRHHLDCVLEEILRECEQLADRKAPSP